MSELQCDAVEAEVEVLTPEKKDTQPLFEIRAKTLELWKANKLSIEDMLSIAENIYFPTLIFATGVDDKQAFLQHCESVYNVFSEQIKKSIQEALCQQNQNQNPPLQITQQT